MAAEDDGTREVDDDIDDLRERIAEMEERIVHREEVERDLRQYVRRRQRRGHARGWGPYLVLLYGVVLTLGAFYYLSGGWAILAMIVIAFSTLGLYVFMVMTGFTLGLVGLPGRLLDWGRTKRN